MSLILIPSEMESRFLLDPAARPDARGEPWRLYRKGGAYWAICGIGPAAAALSASHLIAKLRPDRVFLLGIAGAFRESGLQVGEVVQARSETFADLGYRDDEGFHNLDAMNLPMLPAGHAERGCRFELPLLDDAQPSADFITVSGICANAKRATALWSSFRAGAENMEGAAVALACRLAGAPFFEIRAISNWVGPRDPSSWKVEAPLGRLSRWLTRRIAR